MHLKYNSLIINAVYFRVERFGMTVVSSFCDYAFFELFKINCIIYTKITQ